MEQNAEKGYVISTTIAVVNRIVSDIVGVIIGCGMYTVNIEYSDFAFNILDKAVYFIADECLVGYAGKI